MSDTFNIFDILTPRERAIALRLAVGDRNSEIALDLNISKQTVCQHRWRALMKLGCRHNVDLARLAIRLGVVSSG